jgi:hypothetical protein
VVKEQQHMMPSILRKRPNKQAGVVGCAVSQFKVACIASYKEVG